MPLHFAGILSLISKLLLRTWVRVRKRIRVAGEIDTGRYGVQEAVNASPDNMNVGEGRFVIYIKARVPFKKRNVVFLGDGMGKTVVSVSANVGQPGMATYNSAIGGVLGMDSWLRISQIRTLLVLMHTKLWL